MQVGLLKALTISDHIAENILGIFRFETLLLIARFGSIVLNEDSSFNVIRKTAAIVIYVTEFAVNAFKVKRAIASSYPISAQIKSRDRELSYIAFSVCPEGHYKARVLASVKLFPIHRKAINKDTIDKELTLPILYWRKHDVAIRWLAEVVLKARPNECIAHLI